MLVYWDRKRAVEPRRELAALRDASPLDALIALGEVEAGAADALFLERDGETPVSLALRAASLAAARAYLSGGSPDLGATRGLALPETIQCSIPEGYAYYGLYPESYARAAARFAAELRPDHVCVVGIRSIGTSLSAIVAAALERAGCAVETWTVRPRGHPFDRRLELEPGLHRIWSERTGCWWAVVDEGPGLSGSSLASVADRLSSLGVPDQRIVLFPSWEPSGEAFVSEPARLRWTRHRKFTSTTPPPQGLRDISAGAWRSLHYPDERDRPAVQPQHERLKYLEDGRVLWRFAGLGRFGAAALVRAERLWRAGFGPRPLGLERGFLRIEWLEGSPARGVKPELLATMGRYLRFLREEFPGGEGASPEQLAEMIRVNLGLEVQPPPEQERCGIDGRMPPQEWLETKRGWVKTDALDHHDGHFLPGCQGVAWDVAGAAVEFGLRPEQAQLLAEECGAGPELGFHQTAYRAFRRGYCRLAAAALAGTPDGARFERLEGQYAQPIGTTYRPHATIVGL